MICNSRKLVASVNRLASRNLSYRNDFAKNLFATSTIGVKQQQLHTTANAAHPNYAAEAVLPLPSNIDANETTRFSPQRSRDITGNVILSQHSHAAPINIDITADNSIAGNVTAVGQDPHVQSYDCFGAVSLNSVMQSNVPSPFGGMHKFSHLNMPGGQWSQDSKFMSNDLHSSHYRALRENARADWVAYDENATIDKKDYYNNYSSYKTSQPLLSQLQGSCFGSQLASSFKRNFSTAASNEKTDASVKASIQQQQPPPSTQPQSSGSAGKEDSEPPLTKKQQLQRAFKEYGATLVVFHVTISLASLGGFYLLVSSGIDMLPMLEYLGLSSTGISQKIATGASTFVVAYAIHKIFAPVRISITLGSLPFIVRYLRSKGFLKSKTINKK